MSKRKVTDVAASVRARLLTYSKESGRPFQEILQYFAMERFLFRLSRSKHADKFVLKGGLMLAAWNAPRSRPTKDIDLLARMSNEVDVVANVVREVCTVVEPSDGLSFDPDSIEAVVIKEDADYEGVRVTFLGHLKNARIHMQIDMGFGDVIVPEPMQITYPTILDHDAPQIRGYPRETTIAEKFEAMVKLGLLNRRRNRKQKTIRSILERTRAMEKPMKRTLVPKKSSGWPVDFPDLLGDRPKPAPFPDHTSILPSWNSKCQFAVESKVFRNCPESRLLIITRFEIVHGLCKVLTESNPA